MIIVRTPLRISIAGGGTDLPVWYEKHGSMFISAAINKYIYITLQRSLYNKKINLRYSKTEEVENVEEIENDIIRATFKDHGVEGGIALTSHADIPSGTGLGSSGSFGVGLVHAICPSYSLKTLAYKATHIQKDILKYPIGLQDQYAAALGGISRYTINLEGDIAPAPFRIDHQLFHSKLVMFYTGIKRDANPILASSSVEGLAEVQNIAWKATEALEGSNFDAYGELLDEHWKYKKQRNPEMSTPEIDVLYELGKKNGALGGKLIGAGGGGFLLFYTNDKERLIKSMPLQYQPFKFDFEGSKVIYNDD